MQDHITGSQSSQLTDLVDRWNALWIEPDADVRRTLIRQVWAPDGGQVLADPPEDIRAAADQLQFPIPPLTVHGYDALEARVTRAYEMFVAPGEHTFRRSGEVLRLRNHVVGVAWEMVTTATGEVVGGGFDVFHLTPDGRIHTDYQFIGD